MSDSGARQVDVSRYANEHGTANKLARVLWHVVWLLLFRPSPRCCFGWRRFLLRCFGATLGTRANVYPSCRIWAPWNLRVDDYGCLSDGVECYCVDKITIGAHATVSQYAFLCTATHDPDDAHMKLVTSPVEVGDQAWVCAGTFVHPGVRIGEGAVAGARAVVTSNVESWTIVAGNPARPIRKRELKS